MSSVNHTEPILGISPPSERALGTNKNGIWGPLNLMELQVKPCPGFDKNLFRHPLSSRSSVELLQRSVENGRGEASRQLDQAASAGQH